MTQERPSEEDTLSESLPGSDENSDGEQEKFDENINRQANKKPLGLPLP